ncbi:hypothetical protein ACEWY4_000657 [Coilia grayii]|uniref:Integrase catalytic domain-containing protein n=1 Tax=Coilia grayii TaxID=363190 RepID=A0ABD1KXA9_9TELE
MREDVSLWCHTCTSCASKARPRKTPQAPMGTVRVGAPMERVALDIMGPLNETERKNCYVLVIQDYFTKWVEAFPLPNEKAETVAEVLASEWVCRFGAPHALHSEQGRNFESEVFQRMCSLFGVEKTRTAPFRTQSDGQVERFNSTLQKILSTTAERCHWDWDLMIPYAVMAYRSTRHSATSLTPNFMMFGREVCEPVDLLKPYRSRDQLDNVWVMEQAQAWTPAEVPPPTLATDSMDPELSSLFSSADLEESPNAAGDNPTAADSLPLTYPNADCPPEETSQNSGSEAAAQPPCQSRRSQRPSRQPRPPVRFGEWVE